MGGVVKVRLCVLGVDGGWSPVRLGIPAFAGNDEI